MKIKKLEWSEPSPSNNYCWVAKTPFGEYSVVNEGGSWYADLYEGNINWRWKPEYDRRSYVMELKPQQACQEHFEKLVKSCLEI